MKKILCLLSLASTFVLANTMYIYDEKVNLLDPKTMQVVGEIYEGTPVEFIKKDGKNALIKAKGVVSSNDPKSVSLTKDGFVTFLKLKDENTKENMEFLVDSSKLTSDKEEAWDEIKSFYYDTCSSCHAAHKPKEHLMSEWEAYIIAMQSFAKIGDYDKDRIVRFMQAFASDSPFDKK